MRPSRKPRPSEAQLLCEEFMGKHRVGDTISVRTADGVKQMPIVAPGAYVLHGKALVEVAGGAGSVMLADVVWVR